MPAEDASPKTAQADPKITLTAITVSTATIRLLTIGPRWARFPVSIVSMNPSALPIYQSIDGT
jgi:hypothetical protein